MIGDYFDIKNKTLEYGFFLPIRNWTAGTATVIGQVSANSVYKRTVIGVYMGAGLSNGWIDDNSRCRGPSFGNPSTAAPAALRSG